MITLTENEKAIINSGSTFKEITLEFPNREIEDIENDKVYLDAMTLEESIFEGESITFGKCNGSLFKIRVADFVGDINGARMNVYITFTNDELGTIESMPFGKYIISQPPERSSDRRWRDITATDYMVLFDVDVADWYNNVLFPTSQTRRTVKYIRESLCDYIGVDYADVTLENDGLEITKAIEITSISARELLENCCEVNGCFGHFDWSGVLQFITIQFEGLFPADNLFPSNNLFPREANSDGVEGESITRFKTSEYEDYDVSDIDSVAIIKEDGNIAVTYGEQNYRNRYSIIGNILLYGCDTETLETVAENLLSVIGDTNYRPNKTSIYGGAYIKLGQPYSVHTRELVDNEYIPSTFMSYVLKRTITGIQAMNQVLEAGGSQYQPKTQTTDVMQEIKILQGKSASFKRDLESLEIEYADFESETNSRFEQTNNKIVLQVNSQGRVVAMELNVDDPQQTQFLLEADHISFQGKQFDLTTENISIESRHLSVSKSGDIIDNVTAIGKVTEYINGQERDITDEWTTQEKRDNFLGAFNSFDEVDVESMIPYDEFFIMKDQWENLDLSTMDYSGYGEPGYTPSATYDGKTYFDKESGIVYLCTNASGSWKWEEQQELARIENKGTIWYTNGTVLVNVANIIAEFNELTISFSGDNGVYIDTPNLKVDESGNVEISQLNVLGNFNVKSYPMQDQVSPWRLMPQKNMKYEGGELTVYQEEQGAYDYEESVVAPDHMESQNYVTTSDRRLKENIRPVSEEYEKLFMELNPVAFNYIGNNKENVGLIAQEIEESLLKHGLDTNIVQKYRDRDNHLGDRYMVDYTKFIGLMIHMIQKQEKEIDELKRKLEGGYHGVQ